MLGKAFQQNQKIKQSTWRDIFLLLLFTLSLLLFIYIWFCIDCYISELITALYRLYQSTWFVFLALVKVRFDVSIESFLLLSLSFALQWAREFLFFVPVESVYKNIYNLSIYSLSLFVVLVSSVSLLHNFLISSIVTYIVDILFPRPKNQAMKCIYLVEGYSLFFFEFFCFLSCVQLVFAFVPKQNQSWQNFEQK